MASPVLMRPNGNDTEARAKALVLRSITDSQQPMRADDVLDAVRQRAADVPFAAVRAAIWELVSDGKLEFTDSWRLTGTTQR